MNIPMTFIPGKKYINKKTDGGPSCFVGLSEKGLPVFEECGCNYFRIVDRDFCKGNADWLDGLIEYKEPIVHTRYIHWYRNRVGGVDSLLAHHPLDKFTITSTIRTKHIKTDIVTFTETSSASTEE